MPYKNAKLKSHFLIFIRKFDQLYSFLAQRAYSAIIFGALFCTLAVKLFHSLRTGLVNEYPVWIFSDIAVLGGIEVILSIIYFRWRKRWVVRAATIIAAVVCTWSVMNAGWLIRTGTQILPCVLLPLVRSPVNSLIIIGSNLVEMPKAALALLGPSAIALAFFFSVLARPQLAVYNHKRFTKRIFSSLFLSSHLPSSFLSHSPSILFFLAQVFFLEKEKVSNKLSVFSCCSYPVVTVVLTMLS